VSIQQTDKRVTAVYLNRPIEDAFRGMLDHARQQGHTVTPRLTAIELAAAHDRTKIAKVCAHEIPRGG
jgi:hypothetical protein